MTDWWAKCNLQRGGEDDENTIRAMVRAQNDVYMVCENAIEKSEDVLSGIKEGYITRGQVQRCVLNILGWIIRTNTFAEYVENGSVPKYPVSFDESNMTEIFILHNVQPDATYELNGGKPKEKAVLTFTVSSDAQALAQNVVTVNFDSEKLTLSVPGTEGRDVEFKRLVWVNDAETHTFSVEHNEHVKVKHVLAKQK
jgi:beta-glucosidase